MKAKIELTEFGDKKGLSIKELKSLIPGSKVTEKNFLKDISRWLKTNQPFLDFLGISADWDIERNSFSLIPGNIVGLAPLLSPFNRKINGYIYVKPRIKVEELYDVLKSMEWSYHPEFLETEYSILSGKTLPRWFNVVTTLESIYKALSFHMRNLDRKSIVSNYPIGKVDWHRYSVKNIPYSKYSQFNCLVSDYTFDLDIHRQFKGIVSMIIEDLSSREVPSKVKREAEKLITRLENLLKDIQETKPSLVYLQRITIPRYYRRYYQEAIDKCIEYLKQTRFSLNTNKNIFCGLPWRIKMDRLFEFWVEHWANVFAKRIGASFYSDRKGNSKIRFENLKYWRGLSDLRPDIIIEKDSKVLVIEVKYKTYLRYLKNDIHSETNDKYREYRNDLHQLLAYLSAFDKAEKIGCLLYPSDEGRIIKQYASIDYKGKKANIDIALCSVEFSSSKLLEILFELWKGFYKQS